MSTNITGVIEVFICNGVPTDASFATPPPDNTVVSSPAGLYRRVNGAWVTAVAEGLSSSTPSTQAIGDSAAVGTAAGASHADHKHAMPAFAAPTVALGTAAVAGSAATLIRSDATILAFDATVPATSAVGAAAATGAAAVAARRDHVHANPLTLQAAYTQTYSTAARTVPNATVSAVATDAATNVAPYGFTQAQADAIPVAINALAADVLALKKVITALIDDAQANGLAG